MSIAPSFITPLRYPGGKGRLGAWLGKVIEQNNLSKGCYIEPYAGGAGAAAFLLCNDLIKKIVINDIDPAIYSFWLSVFEDTEKLIKLISDTPVNMESWLEQKKIITSQENHGATALGFAAFFLNRTNRSGIIQGGVIGGKEQTGKYLIDARYNKTNLIARIERLAGLKDRVEIHNLDAVELIRKPEYNSKDCFIYLDPPYYNKGSQLYRNHYNPEDHSTIASATLELNAPWIVTYDNCEQIRELYKTASQYEFSFFYSTHMKRPQAKEVLFYGNIQLNSAPTMRR
ncbi:DNA adenine methylase [Pseudomonas kuykendallii]|uniref:DNA adenine methylase n=1 Tax=Pseudomonas kuykendallii TaxID=1007099 RepID=UPI0028D4808D|nr:DNA adenine methylase [Pseudomonas kuykendallii]